MKRILLVATGGTIASQNTGDGLAPNITPNGLIDYIPEVKDICEIETLQVLNIDSTNMQPEFWPIIVESIKKNYYNYDGFVISHGTDTMAYTASAISYMIQNSDKPIILTGSQKPIDLPDTDAKSNLYHAFLTASSDEVSGVHIVFDSKVIVGTRGRKYRSKSFAAFDSINLPFAYEIIDNKLIKNNDLDLDIDILKTKEEVTFYEDIFPNIFLLKLTPGMDPDVLDYIGEKYAGVVIESYGVGGIPFNDKRNFLEKLGSLTEKGKTVVIATQVTYEGSDMGIYEVGLKALNNYKILQAYDMTVESAIAKLMWILPREKEYDKIKELFYTKINNDINVG